jgi:hypothetical protein
MSAGLERRMADLEKEMTDLKKTVQAEQGKDWRKTFGMSQNDPGFEEMVRLGREIRQQERGDGS